MTGRRKLVVDKMARYTVMLCFISFVVVCFLGVNARYDGKKLLKTKACYDSSFDRNITGVR